MWRVTTSKTLPCCKLSPKAVECILASATSLPVRVERCLSSKHPESEKLQLKQQSQQHEQDNEHRPPLSSNFTGYGVGGLALAAVGAGTVYFSDDARYWVTDKVPASKSLFSKFGLSIERPTIVQCDDESINSPLNEPPKHDSVNGTSVIDLADKTVSGLSVNNAIINDHNKMTEERNLKDHEKHNQKMAEKERKDAEYFQKQKEKAERKATLQLEKEKKQEAEQKETAEAVLKKVQRNQEFESAASKRISEVCELADAAIKANASAINTGREHSAKLKEAMDVNLEVEALKVWPRVHDLNEVRITQTEEAHRVQQVAEDAIVDYLKFIDMSKKDCDTRDNQTIPVYRKQIQEIAYDVRSIHDKLKSQETVASIMKHYYHMMKKDKADFLKELEAIVPEIKLGEKGLNLSEEELNALLAHSHRRIFQLKRQLMEQQLLEHQRLEDALCEQKKADTGEANVKIGQELDKQYEELQLVKEAELLAQNRKFEAEINTRISKKSSSYHDHLQDMLALQQKKLMEQFDLALRERLIHERHVFIDHIAKNMAKVKGLEAALEERADLEKVITHVQDLMSSALCLMHAVAHDVDCSGENYDIVRIDDALKRCFRASESNPFAQAILYSIPNTAAERGIYTISSLEKRFDKVYTECSKLSGVSNGDGLFARFLPASFANKMFVERKPKYLESDDFESTDGMSQSDLVVQAKYFMDKKCIAEAVRCFIQLNGKARVLAQDWIEEARLVLEVRQAAEVLMAYANSKGMGTIF